MRRRDALKTFAWASILPQWLRPAAASAASIEPNAVEVYRSAFAALPQFTEAESALLTEAATTTLSRASSSLVRRSRTVLNLLRQGADRTTCDWGDQWTGPAFDDSLQWLSGARRLARIGLLRARLSFEAGKTESAVQDLLAVLFLGRRLAAGGVMVAQIIGFSTEHAAIEVAGTELFRIDRINLRRLSDGFEALPPSLEFVDAVRSERAYFLGYVVPKETEIFDEAGIRKYLNEFDRLIALASGSDSSSIDKALASSSFDETRKLHPNLVAFRKPLAYIAVKRALFRAGTAIVRDGPDALANVVDPTDGAPFDQRTWSTGFRLTSRFALAGKPPAFLVVGRL